MRDPRVVRGPRARRRETHAHARAHIRARAHAHACRGRSRLPRQHRRLPLLHGPRRRRVLPRRRRPLPRNDAPQRPTLLPLRRAGALRIPEDRAPGVLHGPLRVSKRRRQSANHPRRFSRCQSPLRRRRQTRLHRRRIQLRLRRPDAEPVRHWLRPRCWPIQLRPRFRAHHAFSHAATRRVHGGRSLRRRGRARGPSTRDGFRCCKDAEGAPTDISGVHWRASSATDR